MDEALERRWRELSEEVWSGMKDWRLAHPSATFREIEEAVHERMSRMEAQLLQEAALASKQTDWAKEPKERRPTCPNCGTTLQPRGKQRRELQSRGGETIQLERTYGTCPRCGMGLFPPG
jgi:YgiT-type zinc finger domain-containing protein